MALCFSKELSRVVNLLLTDFLWCLFHLSIQRSQSDFSFNVHVSFYFKMVGNASQVKDTEIERSSKGLSYTVLVLLIFVASYLHMFIEAVLALHSSHIHDCQSIPYRANPGWLTFIYVCMNICTNVYVHVFIFNFECAYFSDI